MEKLINFVASSGQNKDNSDVNVKKWKYTARIFNKMISKHAFMYSFSNGIKTLNLTKNL